MIDRKELVTKHNPKLTCFDKYSPLSVGNGEFVFTADITGLQSFSEAYEDGIPLCTMANWGWHSRPFENREILPDYYETNGRQVGYYTNKADTETYDALRQNPHKYNLGRVGFVFLDAYKKPLGVHSIKNCVQSLNLYTGILSSSYEVDGYKCETFLCCDSTRDMISIYAKSDLIAQDKMSVQFAFPYPSHEINGSDWENPNGHTSWIIKLSDTAYVIKRCIDEASYSVFINGETGFVLEETKQHTFVVRPFTADNVIRLNIEFSYNSDFTEMDVTKPFSNSCEGWRNYWENGGIINFSQSTDKRALELERRVILSQYLTALQCGGTIPPAETGLTCNSWYGKFHLEMHFWHTVHFALFNRINKLQKALYWYIEILDKARALARSQGYEGARWPKMVAISGEDSPSPIGPLLIWQQPHVLLFCEWCYRDEPTDETLLKYKDLVTETAAFMASYAYYDERGDRYILGPPVIPAQENHDPRETKNPTFELEYWRYGLQTAAEWLKRLGIPVPSKWLEIINKLAPPAVIDGVYAAHEDCPDTFERKNEDHPSMLMAYGVLGSCRIDREIMNVTFDRVLAEWRFDEVWGWDFAAMAMTAVRLGRPQDAIEILLKETEKNTYLTNGHNKQAQRKDLPIYLPGNGGLLLAVAMMSAGYGTIIGEAPGFPDDGSWIVEYENIRRYNADIV